MIGKLRTYSRVALLITMKPLIVNGPPEHIMISPSSVCNLDCKMCPNSYRINNKKIMSFSDFKRILDDVKPIRLTIVGPGETFMNRDIIKIFNYAKEKCSWVSTTSNFTLVGDIIEDITQSNIDVLKISIDGATKATYENIREGASFETLIENIRKLEESKEKFDSGRPAVRFNYVIQHDNYHEIDAIVELARELSVDNVAFAMVRTSDETLLDIPRKELLKKMRIGCAIAKKEGINTNLGGILKGLQEPSWEKYSEYCKNDNNNGMNRFHSCVYPWLSALIDVEGNVTPCCSYSIRSPQDYFGNVLESNWEEIWNGEKFQQIRRQIKNRSEVPHSCKFCNGFSWRSLISIDRLLPKFI